MQVGLGPHRQNEARVSGSACKLLQIFGGVFAGRQSISCFESRVGLSVAKFGSFVEAQDVGLHAAPASEKPRYRSCSNLLQKL